jgi:hypothetical protein
MGHRLGQWLGNHTWALPLWHWYSRRYWNYRAARCWLLHACNYPGCRKRATWERRTTITRDGGAPVTYLLYRCPKHSKRGVPYVLPDGTRIPHL